MNNENRPAILILYPHDHTQKKMGIDARYHALIRYFSGLGFRIDQVGMKNFVSQWDSDGKPPEGIDHLYLIDHNEVGHTERRKKAGGNTDFLNIPDYTDKKFREDFVRIALSGGYHYILISYIYWAELINDKRLNNIKKVLDLSDFTTLILKGLSREKIDIPRFIDDEIRRVNLFDVVLSISSDEMWFFSQFAKNPDYYYVPHFIGAKRVQRKKEYDLLFVGSDNQFNQEGIRWFFDKVYPSLAPDLKILITGKISSYIGDYPNVIKKDFVDDLDEVYSRSRVLIAPMFGGSGMKIKVIEALSYGLPVLTTSKGVIGFRHKKGNGCIVTEEPEEFSGLIQRLLNENEFYEKTQHEAVRYFSENFSAETIFQELDKVFVQQSSGQGDVGRPGKTVDFNSLQKNPLYLLYLLKKDIRAVVEILQDQYSGVGIEEINGYLKYLISTDPVPHLVFQRLNVELGSFERQIKRVKALKKSGFSVIGQSCLDIGSGYGALACTLKNHGAKSVLGLEISQELLDIAEKLCDIPGVRFRNLDILNNDMDEKFDVIFCTNVLEHIPDVKRMPEKIMGHLSDDKKSFGFVSVYNKNHISNILKEPHYGIPGLILLSYPEASKFWEDVRTGLKRGHRPYNVYHWYSHDEYSRLMKEPGFHVIPYNRVDFDLLKRNARNILRMKEEYSKKFDRELASFGFGPEKAAVLKTAFHRYLIGFVSDHEEVLKRDEIEVSKRIFLKYYAHPILFILKKGKSERFNH